MEISISESGDVRIFSFQGNLDTATAPEAESQINGLLEAGAQKLLVNFENLDYISSAGLRVLLATAKKLKPGGGDLKICCLNQTVQEVFDISGFSTILSVTATEEEALGAF
jgi:anti-sigma B factor antagonist